MVVRDNDCIRRGNYPEAENLPWMHKDRIQCPEGDQAVSYDPPPAI